MRIAIIGSGISGLTCAYLLSRRHQVTVFEADSWIGGHTHTVDVSCGGRTYAIDTGFIVFNDWTYPHFIRLLDRLGVASQPTEMSFSVHDPASGLAYNGHSLNTLFAQRRNLLSVGFWGMLRDILRFNREALADLDGQRQLAHATLGEYLHVGATASASSSTTSSPWARRSGRCRAVTCLPFRWRFSCASAATTVCCRSTSARSGGSSRGLAQLPGTAMQTLRRPVTPGVQGLPGGTRRRRGDPAQCRRHRALRQCRVRLPQRPGAGLAGSAEHPRAQGARGYPLCQQRRGAAYRYSPVATHQGSLGQLELSPGRAPQAPAARPTT